MKLLFRRPPAALPDWPPLRRWPSSRPRQLALLAILGLGLLLRLLLWLRQPHLPANDEIEYLAVAQDLVAGRGWQFYSHAPWLRAPLYPLWLAGSLRLAGGNLALAALPNLALSMGNIWLLWLLGQRLAAHNLRREQAGLWTAAAGATLLTLATFANLWMSETLWTFLWTLGLLLLLHWQARPRLRVALLAGLVLGAAVLTRSAPLLFMPVVALWMLAQSGWWAGWRHVALLALTMVLVIAPWTLRNWLAYGRLIGIETGFSYNLWAFSDPALDPGTVAEILAEIPNPAERADYASAQGWARLRADPAVVLRKIWPNTVYLWRVRPIEDRFIQPSYYQDVGFGYTLTALVLDDGLYLVLLLLALWGLARAPRDWRLALVVAWIGYLVLTTVLTHGEGRYRHFLWPVLLPYAGAALARTGASSPRWQRAVALAAALVVLTASLPNYPWRPIGHELRRAWQTRRVTADLAAGDLAGAEAAALKALDARETPDGWVRLALIREQQGQIAAAASAFRAAQNVQTSYPGAALAQGEFWLRQGDPAAALVAWQAPFVDPDDLLSWGWRFATRPPAALLDVGSGLEIGQLRGVYAPETYAGASVRWTRSTAQLRLPGGGPQLLRIALASPRPAQAPRGQPQLCWADRCVRLPESPQLHTMQVFLPASSDPRVLSITTHPWQPSALDPASVDSRELGVLLDWAAVTPLDTSGNP